MVVRVARTADGRAMQKFLKECFIQRYGWMRWLTTDQGTPFRSRLSKEFFEEYHIEHRMTTAYHQQADGLAERANKMVMIMVRQHLEPLAKQKDWPDLLQFHAMAYNTSVQASIGYESFFLLHGFHAATAVEIVLPIPVTIAGDEPVAESWEKALKRLTESAMAEKGLRYAAQGRAV